MIAKDWVLLGFTRKERVWLCLHCGAMEIERRWHRSDEPFGPMTRGKLRVSLQPRELARAQGFPDSYILTGTKTQQVARIGNSVCPHVAKALVDANVGETAERAA